MVTPAHERLTISNEGYPLSDFDCRVLVFLNVEYNEREEKPKTASIPLHGYYTAQKMTGNLTGELAILTNQEITEGNKKKADQTEINFNRFAFERNASGDTDIERYVKVSYNDIFNIPHEEVYMVSIYFGGRGQKLSEEEGKKIIEDWDSKYRQHFSLDFSEISPASIYEIVNISNR